MCLSSCFPCVTFHLSLSCWTNYKNFLFLSDQAQILHLGIHGVTPSGPSLDTHPVFPMLPKESHLLQPGRPLQVMEQAVVSLACSLFAAFKVFSSAASANTSSTFQPISRSIFSKVPFDWQYQFLPLLNAHSLYLQSRDFLFFCT